MSEDLGAKFVRINAAKKAAADLRQLSSACKTAFLRDEGGLFVDDALGVIKAIEDRVSGSSCRRVSSVWHVHVCYRQHCTTLAVGIEASLQLISLRAQLLLAWCNAAWLGTIDAAAAKLMQHESALQGLHQLSLPSSAVCYLRCGFPCQYRLWTTTATSWMKQSAKQH